MGNKFLVTLIVKSACYLLCIAMFLLLMKDEWIKFTNKITTTGVRQQDCDLSKKSFPCFTLCNWKGYDKKGFYYLEKDFLNQTLNIGDILNTSASLDRSKCFPTYTEIRSPYYGRCYSICFSKFPPEGHCNILFNAGYDLILFSHKEFQVHRVVTTNTEGELESYTIKPKEGTGSVYVDVVETQSFQINKDNSKCTEYDEPQNYDTCIKNAAWNKMANDLKCKLPGLEEFLPKNVSLGGCSDKETALMAFHTFKNGTMYDEKETCRRPCTTITFPMSVRSVHSNILVDQNYDSNNNGFIPMILGFKSLQVEEHIETYIYDTGSFLAASGGNLGLFLGFSCLSVLLSVLDKILIMYFKKI